VPETKWEQSSVAQAVVAREGLATTADLETYFVRRAGEILAQSGRKLVGWDEIADGAKIDGATVMSWRGTDKGVAAAEQGYQVIMTPTANCYFDQVQSLDATEPLGAAGYLPLDKVYSFEPAPDNLGAAASRVIGGQGNVWTEYIATGEHVEYMVFPRMLALSEVLWSPRETRNYAQFVSRLSVNAKHLDALGVNYAKHFESP
jgi:hexosaminidase